jgi:hypothetical protein
MTRIPSQLPANAAAPRRPLPSLREGLNVIAGQINRTPTMGTLWSILNVATPSVSTAQTPALPQGRIDFQEVSDSSDEDSQFACGGDDHLEPGDLSALELESTRAALAVLKDEHARLPEGDVRSHYQAQIAKLESALHSQGQATPNAAVVLDVAASTAPEAEPACTPPVVDLPPDPPSVRAEQALAIVPAAQRTMTSALVELGREAVQRVIALPRPLAKHMPNERALVPRNVPTFNTLGQSNAMEAAGNSLRDNLLRWGSAQMQSINVKLAHQIALKEKANRTPEPAPYTKLERACLVKSSNPVKQVLIASRITKLLKHANPNEGSYGPLHCAVVANNGTALKTLLASCAGKIDVNMVSDAYNASGLEMAIERQYWQRVEKLIRDNAEPTSRAFELLVLNGDVGRFKQLHEHWQALTRADANWHALTRKEGGTRPHQDRIDFRSTLAAAVGLNALDIARYLFARGVRPGEQSYLMLQLAAYNGHAEMLDLLLMHVPQDEANRTSDCNAEESPLVLAMQGGHVKAVAVLLEQQTDPQFVRAVTDSFGAATTRLPFADKKRLASVTALLRNWLQEQQRPASDTALAPAPLLQAHGDAANDPRAAHSLPSKRSAKVFAPSYAFSYPLSL